MRCIALILVVTIPTLSAWGQTPGDDGRRAVCPVMSAELAKQVAARLEGGGGCRAFCRGCGCKGGPGYRAPNGRCVGYADLIRDCGPPPHARCRRECTPIVPAYLGQVAGRAWLRSFAAELGLEIRFQPAERAPGTRP